ncbi:MAG: hypothetical protein C0618_07340 [Desulfuromonas sp.]|nr:MAG: hypothetical protein C0618_07340 [Desulfuromonas sp.]
MIRFVVLLCAVLLLTACTAPMYPATNGYTVGPPTVTVQASAEVEVPPDQLRLRLVVITQDAAAEQALLENNRRMKTIIAALHELGLSESEYRTGQFRTFPEWSRPPRPMPEGWQRQIVGYQVQNELQVRTSRIKLAGALLGAVQRAGADQVDGLVFDLQHPAKHKDVAIARATERALGKAAVLAKAADVHLGQLKSLVLDQARFTPAAPRMERMVMSDAVASVPVSAGDVTVRADVTAVFAVE